MTPDNPEDLARKRYILLSALRAGGVVIMLIGLAIWFGELLPAGERIGPIVFAIGVIESLLVPALLASRWRTPR